MKERFDACVVGSGAGGSMVALRLAEGGARVLVLERGPEVGRAEHVADELAALRGRLRPDPRRDPHTFRRHAGEVAVRSAAGWTATCVGGGTVIYGGVSLRLHPRDFDLATALGPMVGAEPGDWPIPYAVLAPFYGEAEELLGVSGEASTGPYAPPRDRPFPLPPVDDKPVGALLDRGAARLGLHPFRVPLAILSRPRGGRPACTGCGFCSRAGCPIGAKSSATEAILPRALATGRCRIAPEATAFEVALDAGGRARAVRYLDASGEAHEARADVVVVACGAVESARLLLLSRSPRFPDGLANRSGLVGKFLTFHVVSEIGGYFDAPVFAHRGAPTTRAFDDFYFPTPEVGAPLGGMLLLGDGLGPVQFALERTPTGAGHAQAMARYGHHARLFAIGQDLPRHDNDVTLDPTVRDRFGLPVARITHENHPLDQRAAAWLADRGRVLLEAAGARDVYADVPANTHGDAHQHGTLRFGRDPKASVLDADCRTHDVPNLFVADGSFMPTPGGVNPALTIQANALRVGGRILALARRGEL